MIIVALKHHIVEVAEVPSIYRRSKLEALAWVVTYAAVIIFDVDIGLYAGIIFSIVLVVARSQRARTTRLGHIPGTQIFESIDSCPDAVEFKDIIIIRYEESIWYGNVENFKYQIYKTSGINPLKIMERINKAKLEFNKSFIDNQKVKVDRMSQIKASISRLKNKVSFAKNGSNDMVTN
jgi:MFS superfamily sulfate permease-like transporter